MAEVPKKKTAATKKAATKKAAPKQAAAKKPAPAKKVATKKAVVAKKATVKKAAVKKAAPTKKAVVKKAAPRTRTAKAVAPVAAATDGLELPYADSAPSTSTAPATTRKRNRTVLIAAAVAVALVAGAGGVFALTRDTAPSKIEFIAKADALCTPANAPVGAIVKPTSYPELATAAGTVATTTTQQLDQLRKLKHPSGADGRAVEPILKAFTATNTAAKSLVDAANRKDDAATITATKDMSAQYIDTTAKGLDYGFDACTIGLKSGVDNVVAGSQGVLKVAFTAKADSACRAAARKVDAIPEPPEEPAALARAMTAVLDVFTTLVNDLRAIPVPPGDEATVTEMLDAGQKFNAKVGEIRDAIAATDLARLVAAEREASTLSTAADAKFDSYGLGVCGSNFGDF